MAADEYYWCLTHERVESADERDDVDNALGPYPTQVAAANWKATRDARNEAWEDQDEKWFGTEEEPE